jgi:hypothetical protein
MQSEILDIWVRGEGGEDICFFIGEEKGKSAKRCIILFAPGSLPGPTNQGYIHFCGGFKNRGRGASD